MKTALPSRLLPRVPYFLAPRVSPRRRPASHHAGPQAKGDRQDPPRSRAARSGSAGTESPNTPRRPR